MPASTGNQPGELGAVHVDQGYLAVTHLNYVLSVPNRKDRTQIEGLLSRVGLQQGVLASTQRPPSYLGNLDIDDVDQRVVVVPAGYPRGGEELIDTGRTNRPLPLLVHQVVAKEL